MQANSSDNIIGSCVCCLAVGEHHHGDVLINFLEKYLSINFARDLVSFPMCSHCIHFVKEVKKFREKVLRSQKELQDAYNEDPTKESVQIDSDAEHNEEDIAEEKEYKIKLEQSDTKLIYPEETDVDEKCEVSSIEDVKMEPEYLSDWDTLEDLEMTSEDVKLGKRRVADNKMIRANIIMILKNSTITPFLGKGRTALKCFYCCDLFLRFSDLKYHTEEEHSDVNDISDDTIHDILKTLPDLIINADISCIKCKLCDKEFKTIENLASHLNQIHDKEYYKTTKTPSHGFCGLDLSTDAIKCHICNQQFTYVCKLATHMNEHYGTYVCSVCKMKFLSEFRCKAHLWTHRNRSEYKCKKCNKAFKKEKMLAKHLREKHAKQIKCLKCSETFPLGQYLKRVTHMEEVHGIKKPIFKCDYCGKEYQSTKSLGVHKRLVHTSTKEYTCEICGYATTDGNYMPKHMNMHSGIKNYECSVCEKKLATATSLKMHMRVHMNDKRFACSLCSAAFVQKHCLKNHMRAKHPTSNIEV